MQRTALWASGGGSGVSRESDTDTRTLRSVTQAPGEAAHNMGVSLASAPPETDGVADITGSRYMHDRG